MRFIYPGIALILIWAVTAMPSRAADDNLIPTAKSSYDLQITDDALGTRAVGSESRREQYMVGAGDVLFLNVWKDTALSRQVTVLPDGTVSLPLIGQIKASGKTVQALEEEIREKIQKYLPDPVLDISVQAVNSMIFYAIGKVRAPGRYVTHGNINVLQALAIAGGLDKHASEGDIKIYREEHYQTTIFSFDYDDVVDGEHLEQNIRLRRGDVVVVP